MNLILICGYGPAGKMCVEMLEKERGNIVVIDKNPEKLRELPHPYVVGDATREDVLRKAGIERAEILIASADSDVANAFITLAAKSINPSIKVLTMAERLESVDKLYKAGANYVIPESSLGAKELVNGALQYTKTASKVYLGNGVELHAITASKSGGIGALEKDSGASVIGLRRGKNILKPGKNAEYRQGDTLYLLGGGRAIEIAKRML